MACPQPLTKILKPAVNHWRSSGIKVCMFLDDGLGGNSSFESKKVDAGTVETSLCALGFVLSSTKCHWQPALIQTWLGYVLNIFENKLYVTQSRIMKQWVSSLWDPFTVDRFATWYNAKCSRFNSRFWNLGCEGIDTFSLNWHGENNWVTSPPNQIVRAWKFSDLQG